jgi:phosphomannomutase/phosphoglucomutase
MAVHAHIFREYDIRGIVERELLGEVPLAIGRAFGSEVRARLGAGAFSVAVGYDNRPSSPTLAAGVIAGLRASGVNVVDVGMVPTPVLYYAAARLNTDGGVQITGSHNPPEYNGFKLLLRGHALYGEEIQQLRQRIENGDYATGNGSVSTHDIIPAYLSDVGSRFHLGRPMRIVVDCGNGTGSLVAVQLLRRLGAEVLPLYCESDGTFPNHHPDPTVDANLADLIRTVRAERADYGLAFDGDADRIGAVDGAGRIVRGDILLLLLGLDALQRLGAPQKLVFDVKCSQVVPEVFAQHGGVPVMWKTGHSLIKERMKEVGAPIAGELSGHICFGEDYYGFDDALYGGCRLTELISRSGQTLGELVDAFPKYVSTPEIRVEVSEATKFDVVRRAVEHFGKGHDVIAVDGARVQFDGGWGLLRASNTQPVLVLRYEAKTAAQLQRIQATMEGWLRAQGVTI